MKLVITQNGSEKPQISFPRLEQNLMSNRIRFVKRVTPKSTTIVLPLWHKVAIATTFVLASLAAIRLISSSGQSSPQTTIKPILPHEITTPHVHEVVFNHATFTQIQNEPIFPHDVSSATTDLPTATQNPATSSTTKIIRNPTDTPKPIRITPPPAQSPQILTQIIQTTTDPLQQSAELASVSQAPKDQSVNAPTPTPISENSPAATPDADKTDIDKDKASRSHTLSHKNRQSAQDKPLPKMHRASKVSPFLYQIGGVCMLLSARMIAKLFCCKRKPKEPNPHPIDIIANKLGAIVQGNTQGSDIGGKPSVNLADVPSSPPASPARSQNPSALSDEKGQENSARNIIGDQDTAQPDLNAITGDTFKITVTPAPREGRFNAETQTSMQKTVEGNEPLQTPIQKTPTRKIDFNGVIPSDDTVSVEGTLQEFELELQQATPPILFASPPNGSTKSSRRRARSAAQKKRLSDGAPPSGSRPPASKPPAPAQRREGGQATAPPPARPFDAEQLLEGKKHLQAVAQRKLRIKQRGANTILNGQMVDNRKYIDGNESGSDNNEDDWGDESTFREPEEKPKPNPLKLRTPAPQQRANGMGDLFSGLKVNQRLVDSAVNHQKKTKTTTPSTDGWIDRSF